MGFKASSILLILEVLARKHGESMDYQGFGRLEEKLLEAKVNISQKYLYENMYRQATKAFNDGEKTIGLNKSYVHEIIKHLGYASYSEFERRIEQSAKKLDLILESCLGTWYSYVRTNTGEPFILQAPVEIYRHEDEQSVAIMSLKGGARVFKGQINLVKELGVMNCSLTSESKDKTIHLVMKLGVFYNPAYIKGVFSGVSSYGEPIAGKEVLIRQDKPIEELVPAKIKIEEAKTSEDSRLRALATFFEKYEGNNIKEVSSNVLQF